MDTGIQDQSTLESKMQQPTKNRQPKTVGNLAGEVCLAVHTHQALRLIWGRRAAGEKPPISGLIAFASSLNTIWQSAEGADPFALWWLIKIETEMEQCRANLLAQQQEAAFLYPEAEVLEVETAASEEPYRIRLAFNNPNAYRAASLLGEYDALVRTCYTLTYVGAGEPAELQAILARGGHLLRRLFATPQGFKVCAIDRDDLLQNNQRAQRAIKLMGPVPHDILTGEKLPAFAPAGIRQALARSGNEQSNERCVREQSELYAAQ